ncbi:MAG: helix-turn-helix transcriptional regulator [Clostridia bacterium]|nr:helix-turn-helix transcriptional regulator [Clostridia bacterium]
MILNVADRIRYLREKNNMTQTDLANRLGISRSAVNSWEMSISSPSISNIIEMSHIFNVTTDYILSSSDKILVDITELGNKEREIVLQLIDCLKKR